MEKSLPEKEKLFVDYWEKNRDRDGRLSFQLMTGLPVGLLFSIPIMAILYSARFWFKRADMVANSQLSPVVLGSAIFLIVMFVSVFYKRHQWEMKEQQYLELKSKENKSAQTEA